jgi:hypothetical protein
VASSEPPQDEPLDPWERQTAWGETAKAHHAFTLYRDLGPTRTMVGAYRRARGLAEDHPLGSLPGYWREWRRTWRWDERAAAFDREQDRLATLQLRTELVAMRKRQAQAGMLLQARSVGALAKVLPTQDELNEMDAQAVLARASTSELARVFREGTHAERLARGEATEIEDTRVRATVRPMTDEEAAAYAGTE